MCWWMRSMGESALSFDGGVEAGLPNESPAVSRDVSTQDIQPPLSIRRATGSVSNGEFQGIIVLFWSSKGFEEAIQHGKTTCYFWRGAR